MSKVPFKHNNRQLYWVITDACNYRCNYCLAQSKEANNVDSLMIVDAFAKMLSRQKGRWDFVLSGGEPFSHNNFFDIVEGLVKIKQIKKLSVYTNFSARMEHIIKFLEITKGHLGIFYASLHLDYVKPLDFLEKINKVEKIFPDFKKYLFVQSVGIVKNLSFLEKTKKLFKESGVQFFVIAQLLQDLKYVPYAVKQKKLLDQISRTYNLPNFDNYSVARCNFGIDNSLINFQSRKCSAGHKSFFMTPYGDIYSCVAASRAKKNYLGNIIDNNFIPRRSASKCQFKQCITPADYGQYFWSIKK